MSGGFTKLFASILDSTVWELPAATKIVWITMLAMTDRDGVVSASVPGLAKRAGVSRGEVETALASFLGPDPDSRTKDYEGRRIEIIDGGWRLLNYAKYRAKLNADEQRQKNAERQSRWRKNRKGVTAEVTPCNASNGLLHPVDQHNGIAVPSASACASASDPDPEPTGAPLWRADEWLAAFSTAWSRKYGVTYAGADRRNCDDLNSLLDGLPDDERLRTQARASKMLARFLEKDHPSVRSERHPFAFFVRGFGGLRVDELECSAPSAYPKLE